MVAVTIYGDLRHNTSVRINSWNHAMVDSASSTPRGCTHYKLRQLLRAVGRHYDAELAHAGLKGTQYSLLSAVVTMAPVQPAELARSMGMDASTLTRNLRVLIDEGWIVQGPGKDARSRLVEVTAMGRAKHKEAQRYWKRAQLALNQRLGTDSVVALHGLIDHGLGLLTDHANEAEVSA
jgi:DNA-binding MarR family transcriptional regulator